MVDHFESALYEWQGEDVATLTTQLRRLRADLGLSKPETPPEAQAEPADPAESRARSDLGSDQASGADTEVRTEPDHPSHQQHRTGVEALS